MVEEHSGPPKRVVKKVVKRTVAAPAQAERPIRAARLTTRTRPEVTRRAAPAVPPRKTKPEARTAPTPRPATGPKAPKRSFKPSMPSIRRPSLPHPSMPRPDVRGRADGVRDSARDAFHGVGDWFARIFHRIIDTIADAWHWFTGLRLPHLPPLKGSAITGAVVGFLAVGLGWCFYQLFSATLGTQAGGRWGFLALVFVGFVGFIVGELMLAGFGVPHGRSISILSVLLVFLAILLFFLELAAGIWAVLIVPTLCIIAYIASCSMMLLAGNQENDQRIPWEPTDDSTVT
jgi:hypothetical protein